MKGLNTILPTSLVLGSTTVLAAIAPRASSLPAVKVQGNAFYTGNDRFYIRGVDYQPGKSQSLAQQETTR